MEEEKIQTVTSKGKKGVRIDKKKYDLVKKTILEHFKKGVEIPFKELRRSVEQKLEGRFKGSATWYFMSVKLDLEGRGIIERVPGKKLQLLRLK